MANFDLAIPFILDNEKGYVNNPRDPGGETKFGICKRDYPHLDIKNLTIPQASAIFFANFWNPNKLGDINNQKVATYVMDILVNSGADDAARILQKSINSMNGYNFVKVDSVFGDITRSAANKLNPAFLLNWLRYWRLDFYMELVNAKPQKIEFFSGWALRAAKAL
jgi:lysozyme family protein